MKNWPILHRWKNKLRDKINSEKAKGLFNDKEKENLLEEMDKVMQ